MKRQNLQSSTHVDVVATACTGKARLTHDLATHLAAKTKDGRIAYKCRQCGWFHLGNSIRPKHLHGGKNASHNGRARRAQPTEITE